MVYKPVSIISHNGSLYILRLQITGKLLVMGYIWTEEGGRQVIVIKWKMPNIPTKLKFTKK